MVRCGLIFVRIVQCYHGVAHDNLILVPYLTVLHVIIF